MFDYNLILENDTILLRPISLDDFTSFDKLTNDKSMWIYFTDDLSVKSHLKNWITTAINNVENKTRLAFTIVNKSTASLLGSTSFGNISDRDKRIEIGWTWIGKKYQGKGINNQIKYLMLRHCFEALNFERVEFKTDVLNTPARKVLVRIGAMEEGVLRNHTLMTQNRRRDTIFYSILKSEWNQVKVKNGWH